MPILPQAFWYKVDGKLKQVFFEEAPIPQDKRDALQRRIQLTRNYDSNRDNGEQSTWELKEKEKIQGWYPPAPGQHFKTVTQANFDKRILRPQDVQAKAVVPDDKMRPAVFTQYGSDGIPVCVPPYPTDPMAYKFSPDNSDQVPAPKALPDFEKWATEEEGTIPQWNDVVETPGPPVDMTLRPKTVATLEIPVAENTRNVRTPSVSAKEGEVTQRQHIPRSKTSMVVAKSPRPGSKVADRSRFQSIERLPSGVARNVMTKPPSNHRISVTATPVVQRKPPMEAVPIMTKVDSVVNNSIAAASISPRPNFQKTFLTQPGATKQGTLSLREIRDIQANLEKNYRWRFNVHGDPLSVKTKARPMRHSHFQMANVDAQKLVDRPVHYSDSSTFFYNTIPVLPLSFSVGQGLVSEKVIRDREAKQKYSRKSTPGDRFFIPAFIY